MPEDDWATSAKSILKATLSQRKIKSNVTLSVSTGGNIEDVTTNSDALGRRVKDSFFASESSLEVRGGTDITLDALEAYLKYLEGTGKASWQEYVSLPVVSFIRVWTICPIKLKITEYILINVTILLVS